MSTHPHGIVDCRHRYWLCKESKKGVGAVKQSSKKLDEQFNPTLMGAVISV